MVRPDRFERPTFWFVVKIRYTAMQREEAKKGTSRERSPRKSREKSPNGYSDGDSGDRRSLSLDEALFEGFRRAALAYWKARETVARPPRLKK
jgi:hypothetical protein